MKQDRKTVICPKCGGVFRIRTKYSSRRESAITFLLNNPEVSPKDLAEKLDISLRQAQYYKRTSKEIINLYAQIIAKLQGSIH